MALLALSAKEEKELVPKLEEMFQSALDHPSWQEARNLRGTIKAGEQALLAIETILDTIHPKCKSCLFERGIVGECRCQKES